jgi:hypothetical protein
MAGNWKVVSEKPNTPAELETEHSRRLHCERWCSATMVNMKVQSWGGGVLLLEPVP